MDLSSSIEKLPKVGPNFANKFNKLGVKTLEDLFYHAPSRYIDYSSITTVNKLSPGETVTIHAKVNSLKNIYSKRGLKMQIGSVEDATGKVTVLWFNQPFLVKTLYPGKVVSLSGKVGFFNRKLCLTSPEYEILGEDTESLHTGRLVPVYPETAGLSSKWIRRKIKDAYEFTDIKEFLPKETLNKLGFIGLDEAIHLVHFPKTLKEAEVGRERLAFDELLNLEIKSQLRKMNWKKNRSAHVLKVEKDLVNKFINGLPFKLTGSQIKAINEIFADIKKKVPMNRLLEGDVGSGKTVVAAAGMFAAFVNGYQSAIMAPTQILAAQHFQTLSEIFKKYKIRISLITGGLKKADLGKTDVFIGTHALIHDKIGFENIAYTVIDEQHKFGVKQRKTLVKKSGTPHILTMTATPIPRTVALTSYGDMDLSVLTEMPKGRKDIKTWVVPEGKRKGAYDWIRKQVKKDNSQVFIVCPLIEESQAETMKDIKSVTQEFEKLKIIFKDLKLGLLHGRLKGAEKDKVIADFKEGKINILVSTPVVEVGIDIPNATVMVIESAERFGLAALHQLRGRVGRSEKQSYCLLFTAFHSGGAYRRLKAMEKMYSGFELAELDLKLRGPGEIFGTAQSGFPELKVASWSNYKLIKMAKDTAENVIKNPKKYPNVKKNFDPQVEFV